MIRSVALNQKGYSRSESPATSINQASAKHIHLGIKCSLNAVLKEKNIECILIVIRSVDNHRIFSVSKPTALIPGNICI